MIINGGITYEDELDVHVDGLSTEINPLNLMYKATKWVIDKLYDACILSAGELGDILEVGDLHLTLPSGISFIVAHYDVVGQTWQIPDFRLPERSFENLRLEIGPIDVNIPICYSFTYLWEILFPSVNNFPVTTEDQLWKVNESYIMGHSLSPQKDYMFTDLTFDIAILGLITFIVGWLISVGLGKISDKFSSIATTSGQIKSSLSNYTLNKKIDAIKEESDDISDDTTTIKADVTNTIKPDLATIKSAVSAVGSIATQVNKLYESVDDINIKTSLQNILLQMAEVTHKIGLRMLF